MNKKETNTLKAVIMAVIPLIIVIAIFATAINMGVMTNTNNELNNMSNNKNTGNLEEITATITINFGNGTIKTNEIKTTNNTVYTLLMQTAKIEGYSIKTTYYAIYDSFLIESISNIENGQDNKYWIYYINGESGAISADKQIVKNNDIIEWRFEEFTY